MATSERSANTVRAAGWGVFVLAVAVAGASAVWMGVAGRWEATFRFTVVTAVMLLLRPGRVPPAFGGAFAAFLLLSTWASAQHWYREVPHFDVLVHVVTPGSLATVAYFLLVRSRVLPSVSASRSDAGLRTWSPLVWVTCVGVTVAVLWEFYEWVVEQLAPSTMVVGYGDTLLDLLAGLVGSLLGGWLVLLWARRHESLGDRETARV